MEGQDEGWLLWAQAAALSGANKEPVGWFCLPPTGQRRCAANRLQPGQLLPLPPRNIKLLLQKESGGPADVAQVYAASYAAYVHGSAHSAQAHSFVVRRGLPHAAQEGAERVPVVEHEVAHAQEGQLLEATSSSAAAKGAFSNALERPVVVPAAE